MTLTLLGAIALAVVLIVAVRLLVTAENPDDGRAQFGRPLLVGAIVGLTFMPAQAAMQAQLRSQDENLQRRVAEDAERRELLLQLTLRRDLPGIDLRAEDLSGTYMYGKNLAGANLQSADLRGANLNYADLRSANLTRTHFDGADLYGARFEGAVLDHTSFSGADLRQARFSGQNWPGEPDVDRSLEIPDAAFRADAAAGPPADFSKALLDHATFEQVDLSHASFAGAQLSGAKFTDSILHGADFSRTDPAPTFLYRTDLCRASYREAVFGFVYYDNVSLRNADLEGAHLGGGFYRVDFRGADTTNIQAPPAGANQERLEEELHGGSVVETRGAPELSPDLARRLGAVARRPVPRDRCGYVIFRNRLRPQAFALPERKHFGGS
jgi:uncharacterized protein YjbI with pentapeptide repeats